MFIFGVCHFSTVKSTLKLFVYCSLHAAGPGSICVLLSWSKGSSMLIHTLVFRGSKVLEVDFFKCYPKDWQLMTSKYVVILEELKSSFRV